MFHSVGRFACSVLLLLVVGCGKEQGTEVLPPVGVGQTQLNNASEVEFSVPGDPGSVKGFTWPQTAGVPDRQAAFRGPSSVQVTLPTERRHTIKVVGGLLTQRNGTIVHALLYLTGPPVSYEEALRLMEEVAEAFSIQAAREYQQIKARLKELMPKPGFANDFFATIPLVQKVELSFALKSSYDEKGWYVQVVVREDRD